MFSLQEAVHWMGEIMGLGLGWAWVKRWLSLYWLCDLGQVSLPWSF